MSTIPVYLRDKVGKITIPSGAFISNQFKSAIVEECNLDEDNKKIVLKTTK